MECAGCRHRRVQLGVEPRWMSRFRPCITGASQGSASLIVETPRADGVPWLTAWTGGWQPARTDIWRTARPTVSIMPPWRRRRSQGADLPRSTGCADAVRGCPCHGRRMDLRSRTYNGQRWRKRMLLRRHFRSSGDYVTVRGGAVCKTVGSAYVGSNPTPATTCGNGPLAADSRGWRAVFLCPGVCHLVSPQTAMSRCPRTQSGRVLCPGTVGAHRRLFHGRPRTGRGGSAFPGR